MAKVKSLSRGMYGPGALIQQTAAGGEISEKYHFSPNDLEYINACMATMPSLNIY